MCEHAFAETAVTVADRTLDMTTDAHLRALWSHLLDERLDHLAQVDDTCDAIVAELARTSTPQVADAAEWHYLRGETWQCAADMVGMSTGHIVRAVCSALARIDMAGLDSNTRRKPPTKLRL